MSYVSKALQAHLGSVLHMVFVPYNGKIADLTHADANKHEITLATMGLPANTVILLLSAVRVSGTGSLLVYPMEGALGLFIGRIEDQAGLSIGIINARLQYNLSVANDDWDLNCFGYWTSGRVLG